MCRSTKLDSVKTLLIFCVVLGHLLQNRGGGENVLNDINMIVKTFRFSFHMPLFVIISGYFCNISCSTSNMIKRVTEIFATFLAFQIIRLCISGNISNLSSFLYPQYTLWYLLCLVYWRIFYYFTSKKISLSLIISISIITTVH